MTDLSNMTDEERAFYDFKAIQHMIRPMASDGYPLVPNELLPNMLGVLGIKLLKVDMILASRGELNAEERSLKVLADATAPWITEIETGRRDPAIAEARFQALAELVEPS